MHLTRAAGAGLLAAVFVTVIGTDQAAKWLAWRHVDGAVVNTGGYILLGTTVRSWFADPLGGAIADAVGIAVVAGCAGWLLFRPRSVLVLLGAGLVAAGLLSNMLDRRGVHDWTAPGSARGVVDFIPQLGPGRYNGADLWIGLGLVLLAVAFVRRRTAR